MVTGRCAVAGGHAWLLEGGMCGGCGVVCGCWGGHAWLLGGVHGFQEV